MISSINTNWFMDSNWNSTLAPNVVSAQTSYNTALAAVNAYTATYTQSQTNLTNGITTATTAAALTTLRTDFDSKQTTYNALLTTLATASANLVAAKKAAFLSVDSQGNTNINSYVSTLTQTDGIGKNLTLTGTVSTGDNTLLSTANTQRSTSRTSFLTNLNTFLTREDSLRQSRLQLEIYQDQKLLAQADLKIAQLSGASTTAPQAALDLATTNVNNQQTIVNNNTTARNSQQTTTSTAFTSYKSTLDSLVGVLANSKDLAVSTPTTFATALQNAKDAADALQSSQLADDLANDNEAFTAHFEDFPTESTDLTSFITSITSTTKSATDIVLASGLDTAVSVTSEISLPKLPTGGNMSMKDLMGFISAIQLLIGRLTQELQKADRNLDELRLKIWNYQGTLVTQTTSASLAWANLLQAADSAYDVQVAQDNIDNSEAAVDAINHILQQLNNINAKIDTLNDEIDDQNQRGKDIVTGYNNSSFISVDEKNYGGTQVPDGVNINDILNQDTNVSYPATINDSALISIPTQIPHLSHLSLSSSEIPSSFPIEPENSSHPLSIHNLPSSLPSTADIDTINDTIKKINEALYPLKERLSGAPINYTFIEPFTLRQPLPTVRDITSVVDFSNNLFLMQILLSIVSVITNAKEQRLFEISGTFTQLAAATEANNKAVTSNQFTTGAPIGGGAGILSADILAAQSKVARAVSQVLSSGDLLDSLQSLIEQGSLIGGLKGLTQLPTGYANYSLLGLVRHDQLIEQGDAIQSQLDTAKSAAVSETINTVVETAGNGPLLKQEALNIIAKLAPGSLGSEDEIKELIAFLVALLQLLLLIVAALLSAAVGGDNSIDNVVSKILARPEDAQFAKDIQDLKTLGLPIDIPETLTPSTPGFESIFLNAFLPLLPETTQIAFETKITSLFQDNGISLPTTSDSQSPDSFGTTVANALSSAPLDIRPVLRQQVSAAISSQIQTSKLDQIDTLLGRPSKETGAISDDDIQALATAASTGKITPDQAKDIINILLRQEAAAKNPIIATLIDRANGAPVSTGVSAPAPTTVSAPVSTGVSGETKPPEQQPKDPVVLLKTAFEALSRDSDQSRFVSEVLLLTADKVRGQTDFFKRSLDLILDPATFMIRNFSIFTQGTDRTGGQSPLSLPISG